MSDSPKWTFFTVLAAVLLLIGVGLACYFLGRSSVKAPPAPPPRVITELQHDTTRMMIPLVKYVERVKRYTLVQIERSEASLDSMQRILDEERRVYFAADTTVQQTVVVLNPDGKPVQSATFTDPLALLCYPTAGYIAVQRGKQPWEIRLPVGLQEIPSFFETVWDRFKTGTAYAFIGGLGLLIILLSTGAI